jgi:hypothetical protein
MKIYITLGFIVLLSGAIENTEYDNNPRIDANEIMAPPVIFNNGLIWGGESFYENPESINCGSRANCLEYKEATLEEKA